jgi:uncharacterized tellurite resistance protein B-like protein
MLESIQRFFNQRITPGESADGDSEHRLQVATCALLLEAAHADDSFTAAERDLVESLVRDRFGLSEPEAHELMALAEEERRTSTDLYQFTRLVQERLDRSQKLMVLEQLWRVVYSDGRLEPHEDALLHKLAHLLGLRHDELIAMKLRAKREGGQAAP